MIWAPLMNALKGKLWPSPPFRAGVPRRGILGLSIGASHVRAVLLDRDAIQWAGEAGYSDLAELADAVGRLAGESGRPVRRVRVVLERDIVQLRSISAAPPLSPTAARRYVALEAPRLFRKNGAPLVTDARLVPVDATRRALFAAAVPEPLVRAILEGCAQAGLEVESVGPAAEVLPYALAAPLAGPEAPFSNGGKCEVLSLGPAGPWRSRFVTETDREAPPWVLALAALEPNASQFASAYAAAVATPRLELLPPDTRATWMRHGRQRMMRLAMVGLACWALAGAISIGRLFSTLHSSTRFLDAVAPSLDSALATRRELGAGLATLETMATARATRSRRLALIGALTGALGDSVFLVALRVGPDGTVRLAGYAPSAARAFADLERVRQLREAKLEGPVTREAVEGRKPLDRFAIVAQLMGAP